MWWRKKRRRIRTIFDTSVLEIKYLYRVVFYSFQGLRYLADCDYFSGSEISHWVDVFEMIWHSTVWTYYSGYAKLKLILYLNRKQVKYSGYRTLILFSLLSNCTVFYTWVNFEHNIFTPRRSYANLLWNVAIFSLHFTPIRKKSKCQSLFQWVKIFGKVKK